MELYVFTLATYGDDLLRFLLVAGQALARKLRGNTASSAPPAPSSDALVAVHAPSSDALVPAQPAATPPVAPVPSARSEVYRNIVAWFDEELVRLTSASSSESRVRRVRTLTQRSRRLW